MPRQIPAPRTILLIGLATIALLVSADLTVQSVLNPLWGVDAVVPYRAAGRWMSGGEPYLASSFTAGSGYDVPFLYPPPFLVAFAPLTLLPVVVVVILANVAALIACYGGLRRLGIRSFLVPLVLLWPPFSGAISGGNLQAVLFAAFAWVYWTPTRPGADAPEPREPGTSARPAILDGVLAALVPATKISQGHAYVGLVRLRPRAAFLGALACLAVVAVLLPVVGIDNWTTWVQQTARATDPSWPLRGSGLTRDMPSTITTLFAAITMLGALFVPRRRAGAWIGLLTVVGAPGLRLYGLLFAVPAMLELRREITLVAATLIATYTFEGLWMGIGLVVAAYALSGRFPALLEPITAQAPEAAAEPPANGAG
jgi:hypothetical protein